MLMTTTASVQGQEIGRYLGLVSGEAVAGINALKDMGAGLRNVFGGRSQGYEEELVRARGRRSRRWVNVLVRWARTASSGSPSSIRRSARETCCSWHVLAPR